MYSLAKALIPCSPLISLNKFAPDYELRKIKKKCRLRVFQIGSHAKLLCGFWCVANTTANSENDANLHREEH